MKIAIVCDWLVTLGGAERFLRELIDCYPDADLFSLVDFLDDEQRTFIFNKKSKNSFIQKIPFAKQKYRNYLPLMPLAVEQFDLSAYDLIISSSHAVAKGVITGPDQLHISYVHSPMRYAWDLQHQYLNESGLNKGLNGWVAKHMLHKLRMWDQRTSNGVDYFLANSDYIKRRIQKAYRRDATVIHPPVDLELFTPGEHKEEFYLTASRFVPYKKIDLIVEAFKDLPDKKLVVIGDGPDFKKIKNKAGKNVELLGFQEITIFLDYLRRAQAFIFAAEEDFGLVPVEAQACGTPVIAYGKGGSLETVCGLEAANPTGVFFYQQNTTAIQAAIHEFELERDKIKIENCIQHASKFSKETFKDQITKFITAKIDHLACIAPTITSNGNR